MSGISRRGLLLGGTAVLATAGLASCSSRGATTGPGASGGSAGANLPKYIAPPPVEGMVTSTIEGVPPCYTMWPNPVLPSVKERPGNGETITALGPYWGTPTPLNDSNKWWKGALERTGVNYQCQSAPGDGYDQKLATTLASGDLPDLVYLSNSATSNTALRQGAFFDLTPILAGDGIEKYPNIGATETAIWRGSLVNGKILSIPHSSLGVQTQLRIRKDWALKAGFNDIPKSADELLAYVTAVAKGNYGPNGAQSFGLTSFSGKNGGSEVVNWMYNVPNMWRLEGDKLTHMFETEEFRKALEFSVNAWKAGAYHPDAFTLGTQSTRHSALLTGQQAAIFNLGASSWWSLPFRDLTKDDMFVPFVPPAADGKGAGSMWAISPPYRGRIGISSKAAKDDKKVELLLRFINWLKGPFGYAENLYIAFGGEGDYFEWKDGAPELKQPSTIGDDKGAMAYGYNPLIYGPTAGAPDKAQGLVDWYEKVVPIQVDNPVPYASSVGDKASPVLGQLADDYLHAIVAGRRPMTDLDAFIKEWQSRGGNDWRTDLLKLHKENQG